MFADALWQAVSQAIQAAVSAMTHMQQSRDENTNSTSILPKPLPFSIGEYNQTETSFVESYFERFDLALNLNKIPNSDHHRYAHVLMCMDLNEALKFLKEPETCTYEEIKKILIGHFGKKRNKYVESVKFRQLTQLKDESIANFALRLKQAAVHCVRGVYRSYAHRTTNIWYRVSIIL